MEEELREARQLFTANLASVEEALAADGDNADLKEVYEELRAALEATEAGLVELTHAAATSQPEHDIDIQIKDDLVYPKDNKTSQYNDNNGNIITTSLHEPELPITHPQWLQNTLSASAIPLSITNPSAATYNNNNLRIHPRSIYANAQPDFVALAQHYPALEQYLVPPIGKSMDTSTQTSTDAIATTTTGRRNLDFTNPAACRELTRTLLKSDFGINWDLPDGHLVPPVTNRLNYILWIEDLLNLSHYSSTETEQGGRTISAIRGLDIGCGASLIYPLLGAAACGWSFVGIDVTREAIDWANRNLEANPKFREYIKVRKVDMQPEQKIYFNKKNKADDEGSSPSSSIVPIDTKGKEEARNVPLGQGIISQGIYKGENFAFSMCNPPFFEDMRQASANPATAFGGTSEESVYPGGEESFVRNMVEDSKIVRNNVYWFSTMVGKKVTLKAVRKWLHADSDVRVVRTTEFFQGQTSRWGIAWSYVADPEVANKPLQRGGVGGTGSGTGGGTPKISIGVRRGREQDYLLDADAQTGGKKFSQACVHDNLEEERNLGGGSSSREIHQEQNHRPSKKRKVLGRTVSMQIRLNSPSAAIEVLKSIEKCVIALKMRCSLDVGVFQVHAEVGEGCSTLGACPFTMQLLAQQPKLYVLTIALNKGASLSPATMAWFRDVIEGVEIAAAQHGRILE